MMQNRGDFFEWDWHLRNFRMAQAVAIFSNGTSSDDLAENTFH
ncbi:hypothetical protein ACFVSW_08800 [Neobacillus sp. NPDC058068]